MLLLLHYICFNKRVCCVWSGKVRAGEKALEGICYQTSAGWAVTDAFNHRVVHQTSAGGDAVRTERQRQAGSMFAQKLMVYFSTACLFCYMIGLNVVMRLLSFISRSLSKKHMLSMGKKMTMTQNPRFKYEDWGPTFESLVFVKAASKIMWLCLGQEAFVGRDAPDSPVVTMDGKKTSIWKHMKGASWWVTLSCVVQLRCPSLKTELASLHRQQAAGVEFWQLHLTPVYVQTGWVQAARRGLRRAVRLPRGVHRRGSFNRWVRDGCSHDQHLQRCSEDKQFTLQKWHATVNMYFHYLALSFSFSVILVINHIISPCFRWLGLFQQLRH